MLYASRSMSPDDPAVATLFASPLVPHHRTALGGWMTTAQLSSRTLHLLLLCTEWNRPSPSGVMTRRPWRKGASVRAWQSWHRAISRSRSKSEPPWVRFRMVRLGLSDRLCPGVPRAGDVATHQGRLWHWTPAVTRALERPPAREAMRGVLGRRSAAVTFTSQRQSARLRLCRPSDA